MAVRYPNPTFVAVLDPEVLSEGCDCREIECVCKVFQ